MNRSPELLGKVQTEYFGTPVLFDGIRMGNCAPTDIDGLIEYHNKAYLFLEWKYGNAQVPTGQMLALTRLADDLTKTGKMVAVFICRHRDTGEVKGKDALVTDVYINSTWRHPTHPRTVQEMAERFCAWVDSL